MLLHLESQLKIKKSYNYHAQGAFQIKEYDSTSLHGNVKMVTEPSISFSSSRMLCCPSWVPTQSVSAGWCVSGTALCAEACPLCGRATHCASTWWRAAWRIRPTWTRSGTILLVCEAFGGKKTTKISEHCVGVLGFMRVWDKYRQIDHFKEPLYAETCFIVKWY